MPRALVLLLAFSASIAVAQAAADSTLAPPALAPPVEVEPGLDLKVHIRGALGGANEPSSKAHGGTAFAAFFDGEAGDIIGGVQALGIVEFPSFTKVDTLQPLESYGYLGLYGGKAFHSRYVMVTAALGAGRLWGTRRGDFVESRMECKDGLGFGSCPESDLVRVRHYVDDDADGLVLSPFVSADFGFSRFFAVGGVFQCILSPGGSLFILSAVARLGE